VRMVNQKKSDSHLSRDEIEEIVAETVQRIMPGAIAAAVKAELSNVGLPVNDADDLTDARADFKFIRDLRLGVRGAAAKIGYAVIAAVTAFVLLLVNMGFNSYIGK
jgi:predicted PhzF superfamily epimerase YddE/YHI9